MDRHVRPTMNTQIYEEACAWFVECRTGDLDDSGRREFDRWLRKSPEHLSSYLEIAAIWNEGLVLEPENTWSTDMLIQNALNAGDDTVVFLYGMSAAATNPAGAATAGTVSVEKGLSTEPAPPPPAVRRDTARNAGFKGWRRLASAASIAVMTILAGAAAVQEFSSPIYATALGEQRSIQFADGSTVQLNSTSKIRVRYSKRERDVELLEGEALFHVAHQTTRPFIVAVGATRVRAVGTQFDVYKKPKGTVVTVVEGRVAVYPVPLGLLSKTSEEAPALPISAQTPASPSGSSLPHIRSVAPTVAASSALGVTASNLDEQAAHQDPPTPGITQGSSFLLSAGEQVTVTADAAQKTANPNIAGATAWREREIVFESASLSDVAEEFNRYNQRHLVIVDPELYGFHISGVFSSADPDSLIRFLRQRAGVKVTETGGEIRVERKLL